MEMWLPVLPVVYMSALVIVYSVRYVRAEIKYEHLLDALAADDQCAAIRAHMMKYHTRKWQEILRNKEQK